MDVQHLIKASGTKQVALAKVLNVSEATVTRWVKGGIPADRLAAVSAATGIPAAELRPDLAAAFSTEPARAA